jgi:murein DD-endopeptidase MepM/ murein hydrolase activator NlpD
LASKSYKSIGAILAIFVFFAAGLASARAQDKKEPQVTDPQVNEQAKTTGVVIPPAPNILVRDPQAISIPRKDQADDSKYEEKPAAALGVKVGSTFGYRRDPFTGREKFHTGLDIKARWGDPVGASQVGTIKFAGWSNGYGNLIVVDHGGGITTHYAHLSSFAVEVGQSVERGTVVGYAGSTGRATSPHLHYEVRIDGNPVNPLETVALDATSKYFIRTGASAVAAAASDSQSAAPASTTTTPAAPASTPASTKVSPKDTGTKDQSKKSDGQISSPDVSERPRRVEPARGKNGDGRVI